MSIYCKFFLQKYQEPELKVITLGLLVSILGFICGPIQASEAIKIAIIVHSSNSQSTINSEELRKILLGEQQHWHNGKKILLINRPTISAIHQKLCQILHLEHSSAANSNKCINGNHNLQITQSTADAASRYVARFSNAVSFISHQQLERLSKEHAQSIKTLKINGIELPDAHYPLHFSSVH